MSYIITSEYALNQVAAPNLPLAPVQYDSRYIDQLNNVLRLYFNRLDAILAQLQTGSGAVDGSGIVFPCGGFQDNTTQTAASANVAYPITFNTTDFSNDVSIGTPTSRIIVAKKGLYNFQFSAQLDKTSGASASVWIWPRVNGVNIPDSASKVAIQGTTAESVPAWNFVLPMNANDYFELVWLTDDDKVVLKHEAAFGVAPNNVPEIPSVILTVSFVSALA
jgi:hypothetical protein